MILANLFAWPIAWYALHKWLQRFAYRAGMSWYLFLFSGLIALCIALATVYFHAFKAARSGQIPEVRIKAV